MRGITGLLTAWLLLAASPAGALELRDDAGAMLRLAEPARRIVSLAPHLTELLYAAGAGDRLVAAVDWSDYPPAARELPRIGSSAAIDFERLLALQPDLVVAWQSGNPPGTIARLKRLGLTVYVSEPRRLEDVAGSLERLGRLAGSGALAARAAADFRSRLRGLRAEWSGRPPVTLFYQMWHRPLMTVGDSHLIGDVIRLCGGRNVFGELSGLTGTVSVEAVLAADPQVIVASGMDTTRPEWLDDWRRWPRIRATRAGHLYFVPPDWLHRHTPRILDGAQRLCEQIDRARPR